MSFDEGAAQRLREAFADRTDVVEKKMFGGIAFMVAGNMCCGVVKETLMIRVGPRHYEQALLRPHSREMDFTGRPLKGLVYVAPEGFEADADLDSWVRLGLEFVTSLPAK